MKMLFSRLRWQRQKYEAWREFEITNISGWDSCCVKFVRNLSSFFFFNASMVKSVYFRFVWLFVFQKIIADIENRFLIKNWGGHGLFHGVKIYFLNVNCVPQRPTDATTWVVLWSYVDWALRCRIINW